MDPCETNRAAPPERALVFGGSGHIGSAIARQLWGHGFEVTIVSRREQLPYSLADLSIARRRCDDRQPGAMAALQDDTALIVDAAAAYPLDMLGDNAALLSSARRRTQALVQLAIRCDATLCYIGSYVTDRRRGTAASWLQSNIFRRLHPYFSVKQLIVDELLAARHPAISILNPSVCIGPWDNKPAHQCIIAQLARGAVPAVARQTINVIDVRDVARAVVGAYREKRHGVPIALCGHNLSLQQLGRQVASLAGRPAPQLQVSTTASAWLSSAAQLSCELAGVATPFSALAMILLCESGPLSMTGAQRAIGVVPRPLANSLADAYDWYCRIGYC